MGFESWHGRMTSLWVGRLGQRVASKQGLAARASEGLLPPPFFFLTVFLQRPTAAAAAAVVLTVRE